MRWAISTVYHQVALHKDEISKRIQQVIRHHAGRFMGHGVKIPGKGKEDAGQYFQI